jgi:hypothetical protein
MTQHDVRLLGLAFGHGFILGWKEKQLLIQE